MNYAHNQCLVNWYISKYGLAALLSRATVQCEICQYEMHYQIAHAAKHTFKMVLSSVIATIIIIVFILLCGVFSSLIARDFTTFDPVFTGVSKAVKFVAKIKPKPVRDRLKCYPNAIEWNIDPCGKECFVIYYSTWDRCVETNRTKCNAWDNTCFETLDVGTNNYFRYIAQDKCYQYWSLRLDDFYNPYVVFDLVYLGTIIGCLYSCKWRQISIVDLMCMASLVMELMMSMIAMVVLVLDDDFTLSNRCIFTWRILPFGNSFIFSTFSTLLSMANFLYPLFAMFEKWQFYQHRIFVAFLQETWSYTIQRLFRTDQESNDAKYFVDIQFSNFER
jgi:hypothetical protein